MEHSHYSAKSFDKFYRNFFNYNIALFQMIKDIRKGDSHNILDLACGTGISTRALAKVFDKSSITGIDSDMELLEYANMAFVPHNVEYIQHNALDVHNIEKKFDFIAVKSALHLIYEEYIFDNYMQILKPEGTFYAIERTDISVNSFPIFYEARVLWEKQYSKERKVNCITHYISKKNYKLETFKFGQQVDIDANEYKNGLKNKEMSCLWSFQDNYILEWIKNNLQEKETVSVFEEYDIIAITKIR